ncbi:hypothetical protein HGA34_05485, partial [Candidatus Falkowbacteria bacterium]|nr:hypothetical protein [Candidatus Falkowbacteria bacterium]
MLRIFYLLQGEVNRTELKLANRLEQRLEQPYSSSIFYFSIIGLNLYLVFWQMVMDLYKFLIINFVDPGESFNLFFRQRELRSCPFSYAGYKRVQTKIRMFSLLGITAMVVVAVVSSLITNLLFGGKQPTFAATYGWLQESWVGGAATTTSLEHSGSSGQQNAGWDKYYSVDNSVSISGAGLSLAFATSSISETFTSTVYKDSVNTVSNWSTTTGRIEAPGETVTIENLAPKFAELFPGQDDGVTAGVASGDDLFFGTANGKFAKYNRITNTVTNLSLSSGFSSFWPENASGNNSIQAMKFDGDGVLYIAGKGGRFAKYQGGTAVNLAGTVPNFTNLTTGWGSYDIYSIAFVGLDVYLTGANPGRFAKYTAGNPGTISNLSSYINTIITTGNNSLEIEYNPTDAYLYIGGSSGKFLKYKPADNSVVDLTATLASGASWSNNEVKEIEINPAGDVYVAGGNARFAKIASGTVQNLATSTGFAAAFGTGYFGAMVYDGGAVFLATPSGFGSYQNGVVTNLFVSSGMSSFWNNNSTYFLANNPSGELYIGGGAGKFFKYAAGTGTNLASKLGAAGIVGFSQTVKRTLFNQPRNEIYLATLENKFIKYNFTTDTVTDLTSVLSGQISISFYYVIMSLSENPDVIYMADESGKFIKFNVSNNTVTNLTSFTSGIFSSVWGEYCTDDEGWPQECYGQEPIRAIFFAPAQGAVYLGGASGRLVKYSYGGAGTTTDLSAAISAVMSGSEIRALAVDNSGVVYFAGTSGKIGSYDNGIATDLVAKFGVTGDEFSDLLVDSSNFLYSAYGNRYNGIKKYDIVSGATATSVPTTGNFSYSRIVGDINNLYFGGGGSLHAIVDYQAGVIKYRTSYLDAMPSWSAKGFYDLSYDTVSRKLYIAGDKNLTSFFKDTPATTTAQSLKLNSSVTSIGWATLTKNDTPGTGNVAYYLSNNGGTDWHQVTPDVIFYFPGPGVDLRWKVQIAGTATVEDINIAYGGYASAGTLTSNKYDTTSAGNVMGSLSWRESTLATGTSIVLSIRTASTSNSLDSAQWYNFSYPANQAEGCEKSGLIVSCPSAALETVSGNSLSDGLSDRWFQYKVTLNSDGAYAPVMDQVQVQYVVNAPPELDPVYGVQAIQNNDGTVAISYKPRDPDTTSGSAENQGKVWPSFEYSLDNGASWQLISSGLPEDATTSKAVDIDPGRIASGTAIFGNPIDQQPYVAVWSPGYLSTSSAQARIRLTISDHEAANATAATSSNAFALDAAAPTFGVNPVIVNAATTTNQVALDVTDDNDIMMRLGLQSDVADGAWATYTPETTFNLAGKPSSIYTQFKDSFQNVTGIINVVLPPTPIAFMVQDTSNMLAEPDEYRLFLAWQKPAAPAVGFGSYGIWRSTDNVNFNLLDTIDDIDTNYYGDNTMSFDTVTYYRVTVEDAKGNVSYVSETVNGKANGIQDAGEGGGGMVAALTPATISGVGTSSIYTTQASIVWDTDMLADSLVYYQEITGGDFSSATSTGVATLRATTTPYGRHQVVISGLTPATTYYFIVQSINVQGAVSTSTSGSDGYSFTTQAGPAIIPGSVSTANVGNTTIDIAWDTDQAADSYV